MAAGELVQVDRAVDSITVGVRHRKDLGDLAPLVQSIRECGGLLQPITITPDGTLLCGARRLAAIKQLGWRTVSVWVRSGLSDRLGGLLAEQDENLHHKDYSPLELSDLYQELKEEIMADAARRKKATQFGTDVATTDSSGSAKFAEPWQGRTDSRRQAAAMLSGALSHTTLEKLLDLKAIAADPVRNPVIREHAATALRRIEAGERVDGPYTEVKAAAHLDELDAMGADPSLRQEARDAARHAAKTLRHLKDTTPMSTQDIDRAAREAIAHAKKTAKARAKKRPPEVEAAPSRKSKRTKRAFVFTWTDMKDWTDAWDPEEIAVELSVDEWATFADVMAASQVFTDQARKARIDASLPLTPTT
jgi:ParB family chromosome partitioning protein